MRRAILLGAGPKTCRQFGLGKPAEVAGVILGLVVCLLACGCGDSRSPLSDPNTSKPDKRLAGIWQWRGENGEVAYFHIGQAGDKFPDSVLRVVAAKHESGKVEPPEEYLMFPTLLEEKSYMNVVVDPKQVKALNEKGWDPALVETYIFLKYKVDGDKAAIWLTDSQVKERAIKAGEMKGVVEPRKSPLFTGSTEEVARFVAKAGDSLFNMKDMAQLKRIDAERKP